MPNTIPPRGVRKVSELITQIGRTLIISEEDAAKLSWADIPVSTLKIKPKTGIMYVKLEGESDWVPAGIKNDGTLSIARDARIVEETFVITDINNDKFTYTNSSSQLRHSVITDNMFVFELESGTYMMHRNHLEVFIDDTLRRCEASANLIELGAGKFFAIHKNDMEKGTEVTAKYISALRIGNPYPRIFIGDNTPVAAEIGDLYIDTDYSLEEWKKHLDDDGRLDWSIIKNTPNGLAGYGILDELATRVHQHRCSDIIDFPEFLPANGGNATTADRFSRPRKLTLTGHVTGECIFDGTADGSLDVSIDPAALRQAIMSYTGTDDVIGHLKKTTNRVSILTGTLTAEAGRAIPIPEGYERAQCKFVIYPLTFTNAGSLNIDVENGIMKAVSGVGIIGYMSIGIGEGGA